MYERQGVSLLQRCQHVMGSWWAVVFVFLPVAVISQGDLDPLASLKSLTYLRYGNYLW